MNEKQNEVINIVKRLFVDLLRHFFCLCKVHRKRKCKQWSQKADNAYEIFMCTERLWAGTSKGK